MRKIFSVLISIIFTQVIFAKNDTSLYEYKTPWANQNGDKITLDSFKGEFVVLGMAYTGCAHTCPLTITKLQEIEKYFVESKIKNYKMVLASFDVKKDTPKQLKKYMEKRKLDSKYWVFLSPDKDSQVRELSVVLGISYKDLGDGDFSHSNVLTLLDQDGKVIHRTDSLNTDAKLFKDAVLKTK